MTSNDEMIISESANHTPFDFSIDKFITQTQINKLFKTIFNSEKLSFNSIAEIINKISLDKKRISELLYEIFISNKMKNIKIPFILYIIIIKINLTFFDWFNEKNTEQFEEEKFLLNEYNNAMLHNSDDKYYGYVSIISFYLLKYKFNYKFDESSTLGLVNHLQCISNISQMFYDIYSTCTNINETLSFFSSHDFVSKMIQCYIKSINNDVSFSTTEYKFDFSKLSNFLLYISHPKYTSLIKENSNVESFHFFPYQSTIYNNISSLYHIKNKPTNILLYGPKSSGKTSFAKTILSSPLIIEVDEAIETNYLLGGYLINEFSEIIWQDGILLAALKEGRDILLLSMEKCGNDLLSVLKQVLEKNTLFILAKQEQASNFDSRIVMVYNTTSNDSIAMMNNQVFSFLQCNSLSFSFTQYSIDDMMTICETKYNLSLKEKEILKSLIEVYNTIPSKVKINSRYRKMTLNNIISFSEKLHSFFLDNNIVDNSGSIFLSEKTKMNIVCDFIYANLLSIDDNNTLKEITSLFSTAFNFSSSSFDDIVFNIENKFAFDTSEFNYIKDFDNNVISFNSLPNSVFYSYNSNSKFYIHLINENIVKGNNILLVGDTGVGKTRMIQHLASIMKIKLNVINLSQSSDESDLFGGFKPVSMKTFMKKYFEEIISLLNKYVDVEKNKAFIDAMMKAYNAKKDAVFVKFCIGALDKLKGKIEERDDQVKIDNLKNELQKLKNNYNSSGSGKNAFKYIEGILLQSIKNDEWILLDEINLANDDMLLKIKSVLEGESLFLMTNNEISTYKKKNKFRIFGSMNPEFNIGKKKLPSEIRELFHEIFVKEISSINDIKNFIWAYLKDIPSITDSHVDLIANFYLEIKQLQNNGTLLKSNGTRCNFSLRTLTRALISIRNGKSKFNSIDTAIYEAISMNFLSQIDNDYRKNLSVQYSGSMLKTVSDVINYANTMENNNFILTPMFINHLTTLIQIVSLSNYAVLLEGPTSCGKTSVVEFLARCLNQKIIRINNNHNTEVEEYIGSYTADENGNFYFKEGFLVKAVREGMWIILDEINLAPSEVLEALNRLLDDNRELYLAESNTVIKAHENFRIFAAMNPSENYAGRKDLSDAFKNRFIHLFFDNIPNEELITIIEKRCKVPRSRAEIMIGIYSDLQRIRNKENVFERNEGFITIRDLIKWGMRDIESYEKLAIEGYVLLAEKLRTVEEKNTVKMVIENNLKSKRITLNSDFIMNYYTSYVANKFTGTQKEIASKIKLTQSMQRILTLVDKAISNHEPVLLIGDTGTGKSLAVDYIASKYGKPLITINCHENMDTNDFLGSLRSAPSTSSSLFEWIDGPLTSSMKNGDILLIDEIALVMDSVLERMNSVFEADSVLVLSEKNTDDNIEIIKPHKDFAVIAAMTPPRGEYGKKELSQALRARFTEIYIGDVCNSDISMIIEFKVNSLSVVDNSIKRELAKKIYDIYVYYNSLREIAKPITFRDVDIICDFIMKNYDKFNGKINSLFENAVRMTIIEGLYLNESLTPEVLASLKSKIMSLFTSTESSSLSLIDDSIHFGIDNFILNKLQSNNKENSSQMDFVFDTVTLKSNLLKILRGMSIHKPILIEGSPGVGKTTLIQNIAKKINKKIHRINLSEHTDIVDLIGSQYPSSETKTKFQWIDGVLLTAIKNGDWVIIDEMNLANQSVLEGLNGILENQKKIFVGELNQVFYAKEGFQIFATQNPVNQGGGRKFLPRAFLNRFIKIYLDELEDNDYQEILEKMFVQYFNKEFVSKLVQFNRIVKNIVQSEKISMNEIGEFNLRTMIKFLNCAMKKEFKLTTIVNALYLGRFRRMELKYTLMNHFVELFKQYINEIDLSDDILKYSNEILMCLRCNFPVIISGNGNIGKKHLIKRILSSITKTHPNEFFLYSTMDSSELLGNFDKANINYKLRHLKQSIIKSDNDIVSKIKQINDLTSNEHQSTSTTTYDFEWHDSILIQSIENGDVIILDNVNTCSNSVLDRLNSLLDDDNMIYLSESGSGRTVTANQNFRLFMTMNVAHGEVSRALKNRCVELYYNGDIFNRQYLVDDQITLDNKFNIEGDYNTLTIKYDKIIVSIETKTFLDLVEINRERCPCWLCFDIAIIFVLFINIEDNKINFRTFDKFAKMTLYFYDKCRNECSSIISSMKVIKNINEEMINELKNCVDNIHEYFIDFKDKNSAIIVEIYQRYHLGVSFKNDNIIKYISEIVELKQILTNIISSSNKKYFLSFPSNSFIFNLSLKDISETKIKSIINTIIKSTSYISNDKYSIMMLYEIFMKNSSKSTEVAITKQIKDTFEYDMNTLSLPSLYQYVKSKLKYESYANQLRKLISIDYESQINNLLSQFSSSESLVQLYIKIFFLVSFIDNNENILLIRNNSELFVFIINYILHKYFDRKVSLDKGAKVKKFKSKLSSISNEAITKYMFTYDMKRTFTLNKELMCVLLNFQMKTISFEMNSVNRNYLIKIFSELNDTNNIEKGLLPLITLKDDLYNIQSLIEHFYNSVSLLNDEDIGIINSIFSVDNHSVFLINDSNNSFFAKFLSKNLFVFLSHLSSSIEQTENDLYKQLAYDLMRLMIIDELQSSIKDRFNISNDDITFNILNLIRNNKHLLYVYPYLYFYTKIAYENIEKAISVIDYITSFDIKSHAQYLIDKFEKYFIEGDSNKEDILDRLINELAPQKEKVFKILGKNVIEQFNRTRLDSYQRFNFAYQYINEEDNKEYLKVIKLLEEKIKKYNSSSSQKRDYDIVNYFINDVKTISSSLSLNKIQIVKFINDYMLYFSDIILPFSFFAYIKTIVSSSTIITSEQIEFNPSDDKSKIIQRMNLLSDDEMKMEYLIRIVNDYNFKVVLEIYNELFEKNNNKNSESDPSKVKKYVSFEEKVLEKTHVIGELKKEEKDEKDKEEEMKEIQEKFPLYENQFNIYEKNIDIVQTSHEENPNMKIIEQPKNLNNVQLFEFLCKVNSLSFTLPHSQPISSIQKWYTSLESFNHNPSLSIHNLLHINYSFFKSHSQSSSTPYSSTDNIDNNVSKTPNTFNFYHDANPEESKILYIPLNNIIYKCQQYLVQFENHPVLVTIVFICNSLLSLDITMTPLSKMLSGLDILLNKLHEWEIYSSKKINSMQNEIELIMRVIRHYRKIEVFSWKHFLTSKEREIIEEDINSSFCDMYFNRNNLLDQLDNVNYFVLSSNIGNFLYRLNMIKLISLTSQDESIKNVMNNLFNYYELNYIKSGKYELFKNDKIEEIEAKIKSLIKIAKWDIKNYMNFRDNMKRNYKQLNKLLKENENIYSTYQLSDVMAVSKTEYENKNFIFDKLGSASNEEEEDEQYVIVYDLYCKEIVDRIKTLKNLNVKGNSSKAFKQKALLDLIKKMRSLGMSKNYKFIQNEIFEKFKVIYLQSDTQSAYVCKLLEKINNFSNLSQSQFTDQLNSNYLDQMKGISFSLFDKCLLMYMEIQQLRRKCQEKINDKYMEILYEENKGNRINDNIYHSISLLQSFICSIDITEIDNLYKDKTSFAQFMKDYNELKVKFNNLKEYVTICSQYAQKIKKETIGEIEFINNMIHEINSIISNNVMSIINNEFNVISYLYKDKATTLSSFINEKIPKPLTQSKSEKYQTVIQSTVFNYEKQTPSNDTAVFNIYYCGEETPDTNNTNIDNDNDIFNINTLITNITNFRASLPESLYKISSITIPQLTDLLISIEKLSNLTISIFYNISKNGFCGSEETKQEEGGEASGVREGGYGMADAQGVEDITKEIEDEEQLLGLKEEKDSNNNNEGNKEENEEKKEGEEDNGFEMKTDFKEDFKKEIDNDENDEKGNKDNSDVEREEDEVDNEDNNKMYDDENSLHDEEEKEEEKKERELDLTDKNIQAENKKNNQLKAKEDENKDNAKDVDDDDRKEEENKEDENNEDESSIGEEKKKVDKLDVDKDKKEKKKGEEEEQEEDNNEEENNEDDDEMMSVDQEEDNQKEMKDTNKENEEGEEEDLMPENNEQMEQDYNEDNQNEENNEEDSVGSSSEKNSNVNNSIEMEEDLSKDEDDPHFKSNPATSKENDLGYNPMTKNKGNGGSNTAKNTKEELKEEKNEEQNENNAPDVDQLKDLDQFKEIFDINSILDSVWTTRPNQKMNKANNKDKVNIDNEEMKEMKENEEIEENFKFENYEDNQNNNNSNNQGGFSQGYASKDQNNVDDKVAKGNTDKNKRIENKNPMKEETEEKQYNENANENTNEPIQIYENDKNADIVDNEEDQMEIDDEQNEGDNHNEDKVDQVDSKSQMSLEEKEENHFKEIPKPIKAEYKISTEGNDIEMKEEEPTEIEIPEADLTSTITTFNQWMKSTSSSDALSLLSQFESISQTQILKLTELLKIALEPNKQTKLRGNYKTGKRLNMKKIINFIASNYRQDKIWLRRTLPHERDYYITIAIDDSLSMKEHNLGFFALQSMIILSSALSKVNIAKISVCSIENEMHLLNSFDESLSKEKLAYILSHFKFNFSSNSSYDFAMMNFMAQSIKMIESASFSGSMVNQIVFILSDGRFNKDNCKALCAQAKEKGLLYVFIILDQYGMDNKQSIVNSMTVSMEGEMKVKPYLEDFPFQYYAIVQDPSDLPEVIQMILVKWFEGVN